MWQKFKDQLPAVILTLLVIGGLAYWLHTQTLAQLNAQQEIQLANLRDQTNAELRASAEETRRQIDSVNTLLKDAIKQRVSDVFLTDEELQTVNDERITELATAIAKHIQPAPLIPASPETVATQETAQINRVSASLTERIQPLLAELSADQEVTRETLTKIADEINTQIAIVLTSELAKNQTLNNNLSESQAIARDSLGLSQELAALYLSSFQDKGILTRLLSLPANVVKDASKLSIINSSERKEREAQLMEKLTEIQTRLDALQAKAPSSDR